MKKVILAVASLLLLTACGQSDSLVIESDAPGVSLEIPRTALPEGVSKRDISISKVESGEIPFAVEGATLRGFRLEPDGLEFDEDVDVKLVLDQPAFPTFFHLSEDSFEFVNNIHYQIDPDKTVISVPIRHFSMVIEASGDTDPFTFTSSASDIFEGDKTDATFVTTISKWDYDVSYSDIPGIGQRIINGTQTIRAKLFGSDNLTPISFDVPTSLFADKYTIHADDFTCKKAGDSFIDFGLTLNWEYDPTGVVGTFGSTLTGWMAAALGKEYYHTALAFVDAKVPFKCKTKPPPPPPPKCGNNKIEKGEDCDGTDLGGKTCLDFGYKDKDRLYCDSECHFDTDQCKIIHQLKCNENSWEDETDLWEHWTCLDDCPEGQVCDAATCTCNSTTDSEEEGATESAGLPGLDELTGDEEQPKMVKVIKYQESYIPVDQIHSFTGAECDKEEHWHPNAGSVTTLRGVVIFDPDPGACGLGKTKDHPVVEVEDPR